MGGTGTKTGSATATVNGNIITYNGSTVTDVGLSAQALPTLPEGPNSTGNAFGTKNATVSGNIIQGNVRNLALGAYAYYANSTATISGNIFNSKAAIPVSWCWTPRPRRSTSAAIS